MAAQPLCGRFASAKEAYSAQIKAHGKMFSRYKIRYDFGSRTCFFRYWQRVLSMLFSRRRRNIFVFLNCIYTRERRFCFQELWNRLHEL